MSISIWVFSFLSDVGVMLLFMCRVSSIAVMFVLDELSRVCSLEPRDWNIRSLKCTVCSLVSTVFKDFLNCRLRQQRSVMDSYYWRVQWYAFELVLWRILHSRWLFHRSFRRLTMNPLGDEFNQRERRDRESRLFQDSLRSLCVSPEIRYQLCVPTP